MPKVKLASETLNPQRSRGMLSTDGTLLNPAGGFVSPSAGQVSGSVRAPSVNVNAANVQYKPLRPNDIVVDTSLDAAAKAADVWIQSAYKFQDRQDQYTANEVVMAYEQELRKSQTGYQDDNGNWVDGYLYRKGEEATKGFDAHRGTIEGQFESLLMNQPERVRQKALLKMQQARNSALDRAVRHNVQQFAVVEQQQLYAEGQEIRQDIERFGPDVFESGKIEQHLSRYATQEERDAAAHALGQFALYEAYNKALNESKDRSPTDAYNAARMMYDSVRDHLGEEGEQKLDHWLNRMKTASDRNQLTENKRIFRQKSAELDRDTPIALAETGMSGNYEIFFKQVDNYRALYENDDIGGNEFIASEKVVEAFNASVIKAASDPRYQTVQEKVNAAVEYVNGIMADGGDSNFEKHELTQINQFIAKDMRQELVKKQKASDAGELLKLGIAIDAAKKEGRAPVMVRPSAGMLEDNKEKFMAIQQNWVNETIDGVSVTAQADRLTSDTYYRGLMNERTLTDNEVQSMFDMVAEGKLSIGDYQEIYLENKKRKDPSYKKPKVLTSKQYKAAEATIKSLFDAGYFDSSEKPDDEDHLELAAWELERRTEYGAIQLELRAAAIEAARNGEAFDAMQWWNEYQKNTANNGKTSSGSFLSNLVDIPWFE